MNKFSLIVGSAISLLFVLLSNSSFLQRVEGFGYDVAVSLSLKRPASDDVVIVAIDDAAIAAYGPWPWSRDILAAAQRQLNNAQPKVVAYNLSFEAAHNERGLEIMGQFRDENVDQMNSTLARRLQSAVNRLDSDYTFGMSLKANQNILLGLQYEIGDKLYSIPDSLTPNLLQAPDALKRGRFAQWPSIFQPAKTPRIESLYLPTEKIGDELPWVAGQDHLQHTFAARSAPMLLDLGDHYLPTLPIAIYASMLGQPVNAINFLDAEGLTVGEQLVPTNNAMQVYPFFYESDQSQNVFNTISIKDVIAGDWDTSDFSNKAVLVGLTAERFASVYDTPIKPMSAIEILAHNVSSLLQNDNYQLTQWSYALRYLAILFVAFYLIVILPRLAFMAGIIISTLLVALFFNIELILMLTQAVWTPMMLTIATLVTGHISIMLSQLIYLRLHSYETALTESNLLLAQNMHAQGQLDEAFAKYKSCEVNEAVLDGLYSLAEDYERKRRFNKAVEVLRHINTCRRHYKDVEHRISRNEKLDATIVLGNNNQSSTPTLLMTVDGVQKPVLGRYQVEKELGRGAMGIVYLGRDPKIDRTVAIKTLMFDQEFDPDVSMNMKSRFYREASTAGRLSHPNIVTIYDVGEEQGVSYIAMDYLQGIALSDHTKKTQLLEIADVLNIIAEVANALHYAHENKIVHRDIKPENIIYDAKNKKPTITDFGVAGLMNVSKTKTGTLLGSPSYMSPEQLAGKKVTGQADIFSLGVTMYQLLAGELPFVGDSLSNLIYKITNEKQPDIRKARAGIPVCVATIINRSIEKASDKRYANAEQMALAIRRCMKKLADTTAE